jgi:hypothetical protein
MSTFIFYVLPSTVSKIEERKNYFFHRFIAVKIKVFHFQALMFKCPQSPGVSKN